MKLSIKKENLKKALAQVEKTTSRSASLPILGNIMLEAKDNMLKLSSTNLEMGTHYWLRAKVEQEGKITVPARVFTSFVNYLPSSNVNMTLESGVLHVECGKTKTKMNGLSSEEFPIIPEVKDGESVSLSSDMFSQALDQVSSIASTSSIKPEISGVYLNISKGEMVMTATDSFRLGEKKIKFKKPLELSKSYSIILPQETAGFLKGALGEEKGEFKLYLSSNLVMVDLLEGEETKMRFVSKLIDGEYPNYKEIIPKETKIQSKVVRSNFVNQLRQASIFASRINEVKIQIDPKKEEVGIFCQNHDLGEYTSSFSAEITGDEAEVSFNYKFLLDGLSMSTGDEVILGLSGDMGSDGPATIKSVDDDSYVYVVMPIQPT